MLIIAKPMKQCLMLYYAKTLLLSIAVKKAVVIVAWQEADLTSLSLTPQECAQRVQWVDGKKHAAGGAAIAKCLTSCNQPWRAAGKVMQWPVLQVFTELGYRVVAANRRFL